MSGSDGVLAAERVERYRQDGFAVLPELLDDAELAWVGEVFDRLFGGLGQIDDGDFYDVVARPAAPGHDAG